MKFKAGDLVRLTEAGREYHAYFPEYFPEPGTVGKVVEYENDGTYYVEWPEGSTKAPYKWWAEEFHLELVEEAKTNGER